MEEMNNMETTPETNVSTGRSTFDKLATGFCITGAALSIGRACCSGGKFVVNKIKNWKEKKNHEVVEYFPEEEE